MKFNNQLQRYLACAGLAASISPIISAYEIDTHSNITAQAFGNALLNTDAKVAQALGLNKSRRIALNGSGRASLNLGTNYYDLSTPSPTLRGAKTYDQLNTAVLKLGATTPKPRWPFTNFDGQPIPYFPADWMARGSVREDDGNVLAALKARFIEGEQNAYDQLDATPPLNRFCNHFYDPISNRSLDLGGSLLTLFACGPSEVFGSGVQWGLGSTYVDGSGPPAPNRKNGFSVLDAREAMWRALTGTSSTGASVAATRADRDAYWATAFRSLGDVVHLLQDLSQPQHTRNEPHPGGDAGYFESHINGRALGLEKKVPDPASRIDQTISVLLPPLVYSGYNNNQPPSFARYKDFFTTGFGEASSYVGKGIANYSNRSFFTVLANFGNKKYARPTSVLADYQPYMTTEFGAQSSYLYGSVVDTLSNGTPPAIVMTRESILKDAIDVNGLPTVVGDYRYAIDERVIDAQADLVIPRAVAYSTGLINFFFRGSLSVEPTTDGVFGVLDHAVDTGFKKLVVKVRNTTPAVTENVTNSSVPQPMSAGKFVAVVRFHRDAVYQNDLSNAIGLGLYCNNLAAIYGPGNEPTAPGHDPTKTTGCRDDNETLVVSAPVIDTLAPDEQKEMTFDFSASPVSLAGVDYSLQVVYRGALGAEDDAVVSGYRDLADPMFVTRHNMYDYIFHGVNGSSTNQNEFGAYIPSAEYPEVTNFYRANIPRFDFVGGPTLKAHGLPGWSLFGLESFAAYDYTQAMNYRYTFGPRSVDPVATATAIPPGGYSRIAVLVPLQAVGQPILTPPLRIERQRLATSAFMGETVDLFPFRHASQQVAWQQPMRGVNAWHSDGYVWRLAPFDAWDRIWGDYCLVGPIADVQRSSVLGITGSSSNSGPDNFRLTSTGDVFFTAPGAEEKKVNCALFIGTARSPLVPPPPVSSSKYFFAPNFIGTVGTWTSSYSPWDILMTTSNYSPLESPANGAEYFSPIDILRFATHAKIKQDGISSTDIRSRAPTPILIAPRYR